MKAHSKSRKNPTCSRCRFHGTKDVRVLQHKCPYKECTCSNCLLVKRRSIIYRAQKNLDKHDENSNGRASFPSSASTSNSGCLENPHISMQTPNADSLSSNTCNNPWTVNSTPSSSLVSKNIGFTEIRNFPSLCLMFPDYAPSQLQSLYEQCGNDFDKTVDKILMNKLYSEQPPSNEAPNIPNDLMGATNDYQINCDESRSSFSNSYYSTSNVRPVSNHGHIDHEYLEEPISTNRPFNNFNSMNMTTTTSLTTSTTTTTTPEWNYGDQNSSFIQYPENYQNTWNQSEYQNCSNPGEVWNESYSNTFSDTGFLI